jgi:hypothetical protein
MFMLSGSIRSARVIHSAGPFFLAQRRQASAPLATAAPLFWSCVRVFRARQSDPRHTQHIAALPCAR